jgi:hypothetical protein
MRDAVLRFFDDNEAVTDLVDRLWTITDPRICRSRR